jgi:hypothetical protein
MGQFKPMVKMYTTEPSVELKLKKGGKVEKKMQMGGLPSAAMPAGMPARGGMMPTKAPMRPPLAARRRAMRPAMPGAMPGAMQGGVPAPASPMPTMKKGGKADAMEALKKHAGKSASKAHKGLKTGGVVMGQGGYKAGGIIGVKASEEGAKGYVNTKMHDGSGEHHTPKSTGDVRMGNAGGYKKGGGVKKFAKGGGVEGNVSSTPSGVTNTTTGEVRKGNAGGYKKGGKIKKMADGGISSLGQMSETSKPNSFGLGERDSTAHGGLGQVRSGAQGIEAALSSAASAIGAPKSGGTYKKGGSAKKAYATGGLVDTGKPVAMPQGRKKPSAPVSINQLSGTFKKGGSVKKADGGAVVEDLSKGAYDKSIGPSEGEMDMAKAIRSIPRRLFRGAKSMLGIKDETPKGSVTETQKSVTVTPKKRGGAVNC